MVAINYRGFLIYGFLQNLRLHYGCIDKWIYKVKTSHVELLHVVRNIISNQKKMLIFIKAKEKLQEQNGELCAFIFRNIKLSPKFSELLDEDSYLDFIHVYATVCNKGNCMNVIYATDFQRKYFITSKMHNKMQQYYYRTKVITIHLYS